MFIRSATPQFFRWQGAQYSPLARQWEIFAIAVQFIIYLSWDQLSRNYSTKQRHRRAKWLVKKLLVLGPTFIKIGQSLSTRADLLPLEYVQEFSQLQDRVPAFNSDDAIAVIETELGKSINDLFHEFDAVPLASASLGQVHLATLYTGEKVVIKVQRSGLEKVLNLDFEVVHHLVRLGNRHLNSLRKYNLESIYKEFFELLFQEIDYIHEGKNADRFRENFKNFSHVCVPKVYWQYTTRRVLALEYLPGIKVDDRQTLEANGMNLDAIIQLGICSYLKQLLQDGFFQSDPHPGNMAVSQKGELIFYDFGTMAEVKTVAKDQMMQTFFAILRKDTDKVVETLVYMGLIEPISNLNSVKRIVDFLLENFRDKPIDVQAFEEVSDEVYLMFKQQPFRLPAQMTFILKSIMTLDGIARALDPKYNLLVASQPFIKSLAMADGKKSLVSSLAKQARDLIQQQWQQPSKPERLMRQLEAKIERGELQIRVRSLESERTLKQIHLAIKSLIYACLTGFTLLSAAILLSTVYFKFALISFGLSGLCSLFLVRSLVALARQEKLDKINDK